MAMNNETLTGRGLFKILKAVSSFPRAVLEFVKDKWEWAVILFNDVRYIYLNRNPEFLAAIEEARRISRDPNVKTYNTAEELEADLLSDDDDEDGAE